MNIGKKYQVYFAIISIFTKLNKTKHRSMQIVEQYTSLLSDPSQYITQLAQQGDKQHTAHNGSLLTSFTTSFLAILVCEIGDKTFFLGMIMAMKYNKMVVFLGAYGALAIMTILSAVFGSVLFSFIPKIYTDIIVTILFFYFGGKLIYEAYTSQEHEGQNEEKKQVQQELKEMQDKLIRQTEEGKKSQHLQQELNPTQRNNNNNRSIISNRTILAQAFIMTFLAEWGDRSQIATIALAASYNLWMVNLGALLGHFICTGGAVHLGQWISQHVTEKQVFYAGGVVFILSGLVTLFMIFDE